LLPSTTIVPVFLIVAAVVAPDRTWMPKRLLALATEPGTSWLAPTFSGDGKGLFAIQLQSTALAVAWIPFESGGLPAQSATLSPTLSNSRVYVDNPALFSSDRRAGDIVLNPHAWTTIPSGIDDPFAFVLRNLSSSLNLASDTSLSRYSNSGYAQDWMVTWRVPGQNVFLVAWEDRISIGGNGSCGPLLAAKSSPRRAFERALRFSGLFRVRRRTWGAGSSARIRLGSLIWVPPAFEPA
jgi:hypothetical protein